MNWIEEHPDVAQLAEHQRTRSSPRRSHTKSRLGCQPCKQRRIKCDELRPECSQCITRKAKCIYPLDNPGRSNPSNPSTKPPSQTDPSSSSSSSTSRTTVKQEISDPNNNNNSSNSSSSIHDSESYSPEDVDSEQAHRAQIVRALAAANVPRRNHAAPVYRQEDNQEILDHFFDDRESWIGPPEVQKTMQEHGARLASSAPYLMYGIMAYSASHLHHTQPGVRKYEVAHSIHFALSLRNFTAQLSKPITADNSDALFACAFIHSMLAFWQQSRNEIDTEPFKWLRTCRGVPTLQTAKAINSRLEESVWHEAFTRAGEVRGRTIKVSPEHFPDPDPIVTQWVEAIISKFETLCEVSLESDGDASKDSVYLPPLRHLKRLLRMKIDYRSTGAMMIFNGNLSPPFVDLLEHGDPRAMLVLSYWCALMCNIKQWWAENQAVGECRRICQILSVSENEIIHDLLHWPMHQCGL